MDLWGPTMLEESPDDGKIMDDILFKSTGEILNFLVNTLKHLNVTTDYGYLLKRYYPGDFYEWHNDESANEIRKVVLLWYLNDVEEDWGGHTQFLYQDVSVTPVQGTCVVFPPSWSHIHRAEKLTEGVKYTASTWVG